MMEFYKEFGTATKGGGGAWTQPMHPLYIPSIAKNPLSKPPPSTNTSHISHGPQTHPPPKLRQDLP
jgi:hypothetical protein